MSVLIKGMEMPNRCAVCVLCDLRYGTKCKITKMSYYDSEGYPRGGYNGKPDWCPLVEVPTPHDRLIDESEVIDAIHERMRILQTHKEFVRKHGDIDLLGVMPYIAKIPTIIEAEGEDE